MQAVELNQVTFSYNHTPVLNGISLAISPGEIVGIVGPNGSGKTTILRLISRVLHPVQGSISIFGQDVTGFKRRDLSQQVAVVPQQAAIPFSFTVYDVVAMGRYPYQQRWGLASQHDAELVRNSMVVTDVVDFADRYMQELSGGERQRVIIARALASEPKIMLLDEPTSFLDLNHQLEIFNLIEKMNREKRLTVVIVSHDINLAARYCRRIVLIKGGRVHADGPPARVFDPAILSGVYETPLRVMIDPQTGLPYTMPPPGAAVTGG